MQLGMVFYSESGLRKNLLFHSSSKANDEAFIQEVEYKLDTLQLKPFFFKSNTKVETGGCLTANQDFFCSRKHQCFGTFSILKLHKEFVRRQGKNFPFKLMLYW